MNPPDRIPTCSNLGFNTGYWGVLLGGNWDALREDAEKIRRKEHSFTN